MPTTLDTRKPVVKLTLSDLNAFPLWEYALDEEGNENQDETWIRPVDSNAVPKGEYSQIVATDFRTAAGGSSSGFMIVTTAKSPIEIEPGAIVGKASYLKIPSLSRRDAKAKNAPWQNKARDALVSSLGASEAEVFPMRYCLRIPIRGEKVKREGTIS